MTFNAYKPGASDKISIRQGGIRALLNGGMINFAYVMRNVAPAPAPRRAARRRYFPPRSALAGDRIVSEYDTIRVRSNCVRCYKLVSARAAPRSRSPR